MKHNKFYLIFLFFFLNQSLIAQVWKPISLDFNSGNWIGAMIVDTATNTLIVGGEFDSIGNINAKNIARWDGINFTPIGNGLNILVNVLAIYNNEIYAANFGSASDYKIYKWDGISWTVFANPNDYVECLKVHNGKLYAGGNFYQIGSVVLNGIGYWDGTIWNPIGGGTSDPQCSFCTWVADIEFIDTVIFIGGEFAKVGNITAKNIAKWDGITWSPLGSGVHGTTAFNGWVFTLEAFNNEIYAGGNFDSAGGIFCEQVAKWDGVDWSILGNGLDGNTGGPVYDFCTFNNEIYAAGWFYLSGFKNVGRISKWNGIEWTIVGNGVNPANIVSTYVYNNELYGGGGMGIQYGTDIIRAITRFGELNFQEQNSNCNNNCNGTAIVLDSLGVPPHSYLWSDGQTTRIAVGLCPGVYGVSVTDGGGSITEGSVTIGGPPAIQITPVVVNTSCGTCNDGNISIGLSGGTGLLNVLWSNGDTTNLINNLSFGNYSVTVTDSMGCYVADTFLVSYINSVQSQSTDATCFNQCTGNASAVSTGVAPLVFEWNNGATTDSVINLCAGIYYVTVTDSNGVAATDTIVISAPTQLIISDTSNNASCSSCNDGSATVNSTGGTPPFSYEWSNGATTNTIDSLLFGDYTVTVTDSSGCVVVDSVTVGFDVGTELLIADYKLQIYPNPANETVTVIANNITEVVVSNLLGVQMMRLPRTDYSESNEMTIDISKLPQDIYLLRVQTNDGWRVGKVVKE